MSETLGSLCDKLTVVKLKQYHSDDAVRLSSLDTQCRHLQQEINEFVLAAFSGAIGPEKLAFASNKVFKQDGFVVPEVIGNIGEVFSHLADVNCKLWHEQEKVYEFESVPAEEKNTVVKQLAVLNLERNKCIDQIDRQLVELIQG